MFAGGPDMTMKPGPWSAGDRRYQTGAELENEAVAALLDKWAAAELAGDVSAIVALLHQEFTGVGPVGFMLDRAQWAQRHLGDLVNSEFTLLEPSVRSYDPVAVVTAVLRQSTRARGHDTSGTFRLGAVCVAGDVADGHEVPRLAHLQLSGPLTRPDEMPGFARSTGRPGGVGR
jgi:Domain of unknown function (DUF4440)